MDSWSVLQLVQHKEILKDRYLVEQLEPRTLLEKPKVAVTVTRLEKEMDFRSGHLKVQLKVTRKAQWME